MTDDNQINGISIEVSEAFKSLIYFNDIERKIWSKKLKDVCDKMTDEQK